MAEPFKEDPSKPGAEPEITITNAVPAGASPVHDGPPVPPGHARFYCEKCRTVGWAVFYSLHHRILLVLSDLKLFSLSFC